jgi:hypothetical protein
MHEDTRRWLLRAAFILICLLPTLAVLTWAAFLALPVEARQLERQLVSLLGLNVQLGQLTHTRPHCRRLQDVQLRHAESNEPVLAAGWMEAEQTPLGWRLHLPAIKMKASELDTVWQTVQDRFLPIPSLHMKLAEVTCDELEIPHGDSSLSLYGLQWKRDETLAIHRSELTFALAKQSDAPRVRIQMTRNREALPTTTRVELDTGDAALPGWLLSVCSGGSATGDWQMQGNLAIDWEGAVWQAEFRGALRQLDLTTLCRTWTPYPVAGQAEVRLENARLDQQGLQSARGTVRADQLRVASGLLKSLVRLKLFEFMPGHVPSPDSEMFEAERMALDFWLSQDGLVCKASERDEAGLPIAVAGANGPVLLCDGYASIFHLVWAVIPGSSPEELHTAAQLQRLLPDAPPLRAMRTPEERR